MAFLIIIISGVIVFLYLFPKFYSSMKEAKEVVEASTEDTFRQNLTTYIYDDKGNLLEELSPNGTKVYLTYDEIPEYVVNAFVAVEDNNFWDHPGIDLKGIIRVCMDYVRSFGEEIHGASTITQQLARNVFITKEVTIERKIKEICYALEIEKKYDKEEIMEFYINNIFYGNNCYGIEAAANYYFDKSADELSLSQCAYLCAIPNSPSFYDPVKNVENAIPRRNKILEDMKKLGMISEEEYETAIEEDITLNIQNSDEIYNYQTTYAIDCAVKYLMELDGFEFQYHFDTMEEYTAYNERYDEEYMNMKQKLYTGGYTVKTTLNADKQDLLQSKIDEVLAFDEELSEDGQYALQGAATLINNETGKVEAIVGGRSQEGSTYTLNRAFQSYRQPGSAIKPLIVYLPALENGYTDTSIVENINIDQAKKNPDKVNQMSGAQMTLRSAVENSKNGVAWKLFSELTPEVGLSYLEQMHFTKIVPDDYYPAASLGGFTYGVTTVEMANAYSTLVNHGEYRQTDCISSIVDRYGEEVYTESESVAVYDAEKTDLMIDILKGVISKGTAKSMKWSGETQAAGKTGTTNNSKDGWFAGMIPDYSMSVWVGYDTPRELSSLYGGTYPAQIWKKVMEELSNDSTNREFETVKEESNANEKYLPGRDGSEILSEGYTVQNYRDDHALADEANAILDEIVSGQYDKSEIMIKYEKARSLIEEIYGQTLKGEERVKLQEIYDQFIG